jgi:hypothetical protein
MKLNNFFTLVVVTTAAMLLSSRCTLASSNDERSDQSNPQSAASPSPSLSVFNAPLEAFADADIHLERLIDAAFALGDPRRFNLAAQWRDEGLTQAETFKSGPWWDLPRTFWHVCYRWWVGDGKPDWRLQYMRTEYKELIAALAAMGESDYVVKDIFYGGDLDDLLLDLRHYKRELDEYYRNRVNNELMYRGRVAPVHLKNMKALVAGQSIPDPNNLFFRAETASTPAATSDTSYVGGATGDAFLGKGELPQVGPKDQIPLQFKKNLSYDPDDKGPYSAQHPPQSYGDLVGGTRYVGFLMTEGQGFLWDRVTRQSWYVYCYFANGQIGWHAEDMHQPMPDWVEECVWGE